MYTSRPHLKSIAIFCGGVLLVILSVFLIFRSGVFTQNSVEILDESSLSGQKNEVTNNSTNITVEVSGAVTKPGVYTLPSGSRVIDALMLAGDTLPSADTNVIEKTINKAAKITDGQKIYIPKSGDVVNTSVLGSSASNLISINNDTQSKLESLPSIGPVTAAKIIEGRPYSNLDELISRKIVGSTVFEKIKDLISL